MLYRHFKRNYCSSLQSHFHSLSLSLPSKLQQFRLQIKPIRDECGTLAGNGAMYFIYLQDKLMHVLSDDYLNINIISYCTVGFFPGN